MKMSLAASLVRRRVPPSMEALRSSTRIFENAVVTTIPLNNALIGKRREQSTSSLVDRPNDDLMFPPREERAESSTTHRSKEIRQLNHPRSRKYAILVDMENTQARALKLIPQEVTTSFGGSASVRRIYGDFSQIHHGMQLWRHIMVEESFLPIHVVSIVKGKGSSDSALIMDAMELLYTNPTLDGFCLVSSDSDFTRLSQRLREAGKHVIGFGHAKTPTAFAYSCDDFVYLEDLLAQQQSQRKRTVVSSNPETAVLPPVEQQEEKSSVQSLLEPDPAVVPQSATEEMTDEEKNKVAMGGVFSGWFSSLSDIVTPTSRTVSDEAPPPKQIEATLSTSETSNVESAPEETAMEIKRTPLSREELDKLHDCIQTNRNVQGWCHAGMLNSSSGVDHRDHGYLKFGDLIRDNEHEFEWKIENSTLLVRSRRHLLQNETTSYGKKLSDEELDHLHDIIQKYSIGDKGCNMGIVASFTDIDYRAYGYVKFSDIIRAYDKEFEFELNDVKSRRSRD